MTALGTGEPGSFWQGPLPFLLGFVDTLLQALPVAFLLILLPEACGGVGLGKLLLGLRAEKGKSPKRFFLKTGGWSLHLLGLALAWWPLFAAGLLWNCAVLLSSAPLLWRGDTALDHLAGKGSIDRRR